MSSKVTFEVIELNKPSEEAILRFHQLVYKYMLEDELKGKLKDKLKRNSNESTEKTA